MSTDDDRRIITCPRHSFVVTSSRREVSSRGTPGHRVHGCETCDRVVAEAFHHHDPEHFPLPETRPTPDPEEGR